MTQNFPFLIDEREIYRFNYQVNTGNITLLGYGIKPDVEVCL